MKNIGASKSKVCNLLCFAVAIGGSILLTQSPAHAQQSVPFGYCSITTILPSTKPNYPYSIVFSDVFETSTMAEIYKNPKFYVDVDGRSTLDQEVSKNLDRTSMLAELKSFGFDDTYSIHCNGFTDKATANRIRDFYLNYHPNSIAYFSTTWPSITKPVPLSKPATDFLAGIVPPKAQASSSKNDAIIVRDTGQPAAAKPAGEPAAKPVAAAKPVPKPAAKPAPKKPWKGCGRKGQPNCRAKPM